MSGVLYAKVNGTWMPVPTGKVHQARGWPIVVKETPPVAADYDEPTIPFHAIWVEIPGVTATNYLEGKVLDHVLGAVSYTMPTSLYLCLHTDDPGETGDAFQVAGGSYAPKLITLGTHVENQGISSNSQTYLDMPAVHITHFAVRENSPTGPPVLVGPLSNPRTITAGEPYVLGVGQIIVRCD